jgi:hypothetical protein
VENNRFHFYNFEGLLQPLKFNEAKEQLCMDRSVTDKKGWGQLACPKEWKKYDKRNE